jgi:hypothetical protein
MEQSPSPLRRLLGFLWIRRYYWTVPLMLISLLFLLLAYLARSAGHSRLYPM